MQVLVFSQQFCAWVVDVTKYQQIGHNFSFLSCFPS